MPFLRWMVRTLILAGSALLIWQAVSPGYLLHLWLTLQLGRVIDWESTWQNVGSILAMVILSLTFMIFLFGPKETSKKGGGILGKTIGATFSALGTFIARVWCWWWEIPFPGTNNN